MAGAKQLLKFLLVLSALLAIGWWLDEYSIELYNDDSTTNYSNFHETVWIIVALLTASGLVHLVFYLLIANTAMFRTIRLPLVLLLTIGTSALSTGQLIDWRVIEYLRHGQWFWLAYYPLISIGAVLVRYFWLRNRGRLDSAVTSDTPAKPNRP